MLIKESKLSYMTKFFDKEPMCITVEQLLECTSTARLKALTEQIRKLRAIVNDETKSPEERERAKITADNAKRQTPTVLANVVCEGGKERKNIIRFTGLIGIDIDHISEDETLRLVMLLKQCPHVVFVQPSSSRKGLHIFFHIDCAEWLNQLWDGKDVKPFNFVYDNVKEYVEEKYDVTTDDKCRNAERVFALCYDEETYLNVNAEPLHIDVSQYAPVAHFAKKNAAEARYSVDITKVAGAALRAVDDAGVKFTEGSRNDFILKFASQLNVYGVDQMAAAAYCERYAEGDFTEDEIHRTVASAYSYTESHGTKKFGKQKAEDDAIAIDDDYVKAMLEMADEYSAKYLLDVNKDYPEKECILKHNEVGFIGKGELSAIKGKQKQGKTQLISILIAAILCGRWNNIERFCSSQCKVLVFDTEQHPADVSLAYERACKMAGMEYANHHDIYRSYILRDVFEIAELKNIIISQIAAQKPEIIFIDGIVDLIRDFNEVIESKEVVDWLCQVASYFDCALVTVLHENKRDDDKNMRGHLGTRISQKATTTLECSKDKKTGIFTVSSADTRRKPIDDFSFQFDADDNIVPADQLKVQLANMAKMEKAERKELEKQKVQDDHLTVLKGIIKEHNGIVKLSDLKKLYKEKSGISALSTCKIHIMTLVETGKLCKSADDLISLTPIPDVF